MRPITTQIAILTRLYVRLEGHGALLASAPQNMRMLALSLTHEDSKRIMPQLINRKPRLVFHIREDAVPWVHSIEKLPEYAVWTDRKYLKEMLNRASMFGDSEMRPLRKVEMERLQAGLGGQGAWCKGIPILEE